MSGCWILTAADDSHLTYFSRVHSSSRWNGFLWKHFIRFAPVRAFLFSAQRKSFDTYHYHCCMHVVVAQCMYLFPHKNKTRQLSVMHRTWTYEWWLDSCHFECRILNALWQHCVCVAFTVHRHHSAIFLARRLFILVNFLCCLNERMSQSLCERKKKPTHIAVQAIFNWHQNIFEANEYEIKKIVHKRNNEPRWASSSSKMLSVSLQHEGNNKRVRKREREARRKNGTENEYTAFNYVEECKIIGFV